MSIHAANIYSSYRKCNSYSIAKMTLYDLYV